MRKELLINILFSVVMGFELAFAVFGLLLSVVVVISKPELLTQLFLIIGLPGLLCSGIVFWFMKTMSPISVQVGEEQTPIIGKED